MVERLTTGEDAVVVVRGHAGTGKTYALDACREVWERSGHRVVGCALSAQAAAELQAGSAITATTVDRLLLDLADGRWSVLPVQHSALVVDGAGMVGTRLLERLLDRAKQAGAKIVLVGDDHQLPEIDAGGAFRGLCDRLGAVELTANLRQREVWERQALQLVREGGAEEAIRAYLEHGRVVVGPSADSVRARLVADWWAAEQGDPAGGVMVALRRADVRELNERAWALRVAAGEVTGRQLELPTGAFAAGDRVVATKNARRLGVVNGSRGTVVDIGERDRTLRVRLDVWQGTDSGPVVSLPGEYLDGGHLAHAYAITGHKAQGMTASRSFVLGDETLYREWGYVALSRGREENRLYIVAGGPDEADDPAHGLATTPSASHAIWNLTAALRASRAQRLAIDQMGASDGAAQRRDPWPLRRVADQLDDAHLRAEVAAVKAVLGEPRPKPNSRSANPEAAIAELEEERGRLEGRRADLQGDIFRYHVELAVTGGLLIGRRHRQERRWREADVRRATKEIERIDGERLPVLASRLAELHADAAEERAWRERQRGGRQWFAALQREASSRIERRAQAVEAAPSAALVDGAPPALADRDAWRARVRATETAHLWHGTEASSTAVATTRDGANGVADHVPVRGRPDIVEIIKRLSEVEGSEQERARLARERAEQRQRDRHVAPHRPYRVPHDRYAARNPDGPYMSP